MARKRPAWEVPRKSSIVRQAWWAKLTPEERAAFVARRAEANREANRRRALMTRADMLRGRVAP